MTPEQFQQLLAAVQQSRPESSFSWLQAAMALGATLVSVTGVVVGMRAAISTLADQLREQRKCVEDVRLELVSMGREMAVIKYAIGVENKENER